MFFNKLEGTPLSAYAKMVQELRKRAETELQIRPDQIVVRDLRPEDIGLTQGRFTSTMTTAGAWNKITNTYTVIDNRFIGISGVFYAKATGTQAASQLRVNRASSTARYWNIQGINITENAQRFFDDPVITGQNQILTIEAFVPTNANTSKAEDIILMGAVAERKGILINPD
ncbi:hypothetical protein LCGC14_1171710 [marine sediment metagenome]|uniref:Uncharacterized protein n=1 Tax=marine sediment metagenome TaxID=412755 RepID=A0A0F9P7T9_9ZZZZ